MAGVTKKHTYLRILGASLSAYFGVILSGFLTSFFITNLDCPGSLIFHLVALSFYIVVFTFLPINNLKYFLLLVVLFFSIIFSITPRMLPVRNSVSFDGRLNGASYSFIPETSDYYYFTMLIQTEKQRKVLEALLPHDDLGPYAKITVNSVDGQISRLMSIRFDLLKPFMGPDEVIVMVDYLKKGCTYQISAILGRIENDKSPPIILWPSFLNPKHQFVDKSMVVSDREMTDELIPADNIPARFLPSVIIYSQSWTVGALIKFVIPNKIRDYNALIGTTAISLMVCFVLIFALSKKIYTLRMR